MSTANQTRRLGIVIITRNEAARVGKCIESVLAATAKNFSDADVVIVDSDSQDETTAVAARYPVRVFRYRASRMSAAAGRWIGLKQVDARFILFLDGDCELVPDWLEVAMAEMEATPTAGVICGARRNVYDGPNGVEVEDAGCDLGGTALYRQEALMRSKGFNPFIIGSEEQELSVRLQASGFTSLRTLHLMSIHNTAKKESMAGMWRRFRSGMQSGPGQVLRVAIKDGLFIKHARRFDRYILTFIYLVLGICVAIFAILGHPRPFEEWIVVGVAAFLLLGWRRRSLGEAAFIVTDWVSVAVGSFRTFVRRPASPDEFRYTIEAVRSDAAPLDHPKSQASGATS